MATIIMDSAKVIEAANNVIKDILAERKKRDEESIFNVMKEKHFSFRHMRIYYLNREEAIDYINNNYSLGYGFSYYAYGTLSDAKKLLKLAQHGDPVTLNQEDISVLF